MNCSNHSAQLAPAGCASNAKEFKVQLGKQQQPRKEVQFTPPSVADDSRLFHGQV